MHETLPEENIRKIEKHFIRIGLPFDPKPDAFHLALSTYFCCMKTVEPAPGEGLANTPKPPYYAVIFSSIRTETDQDYGKTAQRMSELAATMPGYLGAESAREAIGITVSYWKDLESIKNWKYQLEHVEARDKGRETWYSAYRLRVALVERDYGFEKR